MTTVSGALAASRKTTTTAVKAATDNKPMTIAQYVNKMGGEIAKALPSVMTPERFTRITLSALSTNPKLQECSPQSFLGAMMTGAQLGLEPNTPLGQCYLIPRYNGKTGKQECSFQLGYKGLIDLAYRSGEITMVSAYTVYANDEFEVTLGLEPNVVHKPAKTDRGEPVAFYAVWKGKNGGCGFEVMTMEDVRAHAKKFSDAYKKGWSSPWDTNFEEMAKKTVLKKCLKYAPLKTEFAREVTQDGTVHNTIGEDMTLEPVVLDAEGSVSDVQEPENEQLNE